MTLQRKRRRSRLIIITGVLMSLIVGAAIFMLLRSGSYGRAEPAIETTTIVIAARDIAARATITHEDLMLREVPADATNAQAFTDMADVVDRVAAVPVAPGQPMFPNLLASADPGATWNLPEPGEEPGPDDPSVRAAAVMVPDDRAVAGTLEAGHRVDVIATVPITPREGDEAAAQAVASGPSTKVTLQNITILSRSGEIYILHVDLEMAEELAEIQAAGGTFTLVLRPQSDEREADTDGATLGELVEQYGFPLPRFVDAGTDSTRTEP